MTIMADMNSAGIVSRCCGHRWYRRSLWSRGLPWAANPSAAQLMERSHLGSPSGSFTAASILTPTPSCTSRVLGCLSHMTRVFVPVITTSISVCDTEYHFLLKHWWICLNRVWTTQGNWQSAKMANWHSLATTCYFGELVYDANQGLT